VQLEHPPAARGVRFGMTTQEFLTAVYAGSDDTVLIGAVTVLCALIAARLRPRPRPRR
jgi:hypothetical protein